MQGNIKTILFILILLALTTTVSAIDATGGTITYSGAYTIHTFTTSGTFNVTDSTGTIDYLLIGGGGGGAGPIGGGGGAGGFVEVQGQSVSVSAYSIIVGTGGAGTAGSDGNNGGNTTFTGIDQANGGGGGAYYTGATGRTGKSGASGGGGSAGDTTGGSGGSTTGDGYNGGGGRSGTNPWASGGGGGAGGVGGTGGATGGNGGAGNASSINGSSVTYSCGGGGGIYNIYTAGTAGCSTAGAGNFGTGNGYSATDGYGGGGGGAGNGGTGGDGGDGVVIIRYLTGAPDYVVIQTYDAYTNAAILNFTANVTFNGTTTEYTTTNGSVYTTIEENTGLLNVTITTDYSGGYFSTSYTDYDSVDTSLLVYLHSSEITFYAYNKVNGSEVTSFTATTTNNTATDTNPTLNLSVGTYTATFSKLGYYTANTTFTTTALEQSNKNFSVYDHKLNVSINVLSGNATNNNFTIDIYALNATYHEQISTTNGEAIANLTAGEYTVWVNDTLHTLTAANITLNTSANYTELEIDLLTQDTFNISFYDEITNTQLTNTTIYLEVISALDAENYTITNGSTEIQALVPEEYTLRYYYDTLRPREYFITLADQSYENIRLYLIEENASTAYTPLVTDENDAACSQNTVSLLRYYTDINGYRTVAMAQTDTNGYAIFYVEPNTINYKLYFTGSCGSFTTAPQKIISSTNSFTVTGAQTYLTSAQAIHNATINLTYLNSTQTFVFDWQDSTNTVTQGCLYVYRQYRGVQTNNYTQCSEASTGSLIYTLTGNTTDSKYYAQGILETNTEYSDYSYTTAIISFSTVRNAWGTAGAFWSIIILLGVILLFGQTISTLVISLIGAFSILTVFEILPGAGSAIGSIIIIGGIILYKIRTL